MQLSCKRPFDIAGDVDTLVKLKMYKESQ